MDHPCHLTTKIRKSKIKTMCTLDTFDFTHHDTNNKQNRNKNGTSFLTQTKSTIPKHKQNKRNHTHHKSQHSTFTYSRMKQTTPKTKPKRIMSIAHNNTRLKTDYSQNEQPLGFKRIVSQLKKKLIFPSDSYKLQSYKMIKGIHETQFEQYYSIKAGTTFPKKYTLIKTKSNQIAHNYELEYTYYNEIIQKINQEQKKLLLKVYKIWKQKKQWMITIDHHINPQWQNHTFYLFLNQFKNNNHILKTLVKHIAQIIHIFTKAGRSHNNISINNLYFPVIKGEMQTTGSIKLGGLTKNINYKEKSAYLNLPLLFKTPPEILNLILFEQQQPFDRDYLQQITELKEGWQTDVWSLGILVLELLNGGPLAGEGSNCSQLLTLQRQLLIRYSYLLEKLDPPFQTCLSNMLNLNPSARPHPKHIIQLL